MQQRDLFVKHHQHCTLSTGAPTEADRAHLQAAAIDVSKRLCVSIRARHSVSHLTHTYVWLAHRGQRQAGTENTASDHGCIWLQDFPAGDLAFAQTWKAFGAFATPSGRPGIGFPSVGAFLEWSEATASTFARIRDWRSRWRACPCLKRFSGGAWWGFWRPFEERHARSLKHCGVDPHCPRCSGTGGQGVSRL